MTNYVLLQGLAVLHCTCDADVDSVSGVLLVALAEKSMLLEQAI